MSLSDSERRSFEELEAQLRASDPDFARKISGSNLGQFSTKKIILGVMLFVVGMIALLAGITMKLEIVGILGFVLMGAGAYVAGTKIAGTRTPKQNAAGKTKTSSFMKGLEDAWEERRRNEGR